MTEDLEEAKRQLEKLLREYNANRGMAAFVCGRPVELMPQSEQDRIINGFCTLENLEIISLSRRKLQKAKELQLGEAENAKIEAAIPILDGLVAVFTSYMNDQLGIAELRQEVSKLLHKPVPSVEEELVDALAHLMETLDFLAAQPLASKDNWESLIDCAQMHDALCRMKDVGTALQGLVAKEVGGIIKRSAAIDSTVDLAERHIEVLELFFRQEIKIPELADHVTKLITKLKEIWEYGTN
jgi:hypothetical protein